MRSTRYSCQVLMNLNFLDRISKKLKNPSNRISYTMQSDRRRERERERQTDRQPDMT